MSSTPVMTPRQELTTLSVKKKKKKPEGSKLVLKSPFAEFFPAVTQEESNKITQALKKLPQIFAKKQVVPTIKQIKAIPKAERKKFRESLNPPVPAVPQIRDNIVIGFNKVVELLNEDKLKLVLLSADINPKLMMQQIIDICVLKSVKVLIVDVLRTTVYETLGVATSSFGILVKTNLDERLAHVLRVSLTIAENYIPPSGHVFSKPVYPISIEHDVVKKSSDDIQHTNCMKPIKNCLLKRDDPKIRQFIPTIDITTDKKKTPSNGDAFNADFIGFKRSAQPLQATNVVQARKSLFSMRTKMEKRMARIENGRVTKKNNRMKKKNKKL